MLEEKLRELAQSNRYPFHMPGHKRMLDGTNPYAIDITEIEDFDNLHHAEGIIKDAEDAAAKMYGAKKAYYLVNGSTCGILAAISASVKRGGKILVARNCHKSVYHAIFLRQLSPEYVYPENTHYGIQGQILVKAIEKKLAECPDIQAVVLTSPTYDGLVSDVKSIAEVVHRRNITLIVDEAHGAHFGFHEAFPENAVAYAVYIRHCRRLPRQPCYAYVRTESMRKKWKSISEFMRQVLRPMCSWQALNAVFVWFRTVEENCLQHMLKNFPVFVQVSAT